jgi:large subunit ribosomal protein L4
MKLDVFNGKNKSKIIEVKAVVGGKSDSVVYQAVVARLSHNRSGNASTLTKSEVRGGGKKPWKQKGLGRARAGSIRSPLWRGGGVTFGPKPRDFSKDINRKQRMKAYITAFTRLNEKGALQVITDFQFDSMKTRDFLKALAAVTDNVNQKLTLIVESYNRALYLASRNLTNVTVTYIENIDLLHLVYAEKVLITEKALQVLDERYSAYFTDGVSK